MPEPNELLNPYFIKESIIEFLKTSNEKYQHVDFTESDSQSLITDISSYITMLISNKFEQSLSDFYIQTQSNDKIDLLLSQYGYKKSFGVPSQVNLSLFFDEKTMIQFNRLEMENFVIPPLILKIIDTNGNTWLNKNSILVTRTVEKFGIHGEFFRYRMSSQNGGNIFPFIQMKVSINEFNMNTEQLSRNTFLNVSNGYLVKDHYIDDFTRINLDLRLYRKVIDSDNHIHYKLFEKIREIQNSKFHIDDFETYANNEYFTISYNEVQNTFDILTGDDINYGYKLKSSDLNLTLQYYNTLGQEQNQFLGQVNKYSGLQDYILINDNIYNINNILEYNIQILFIPQKLKIKFNMNTGRKLTQEELDNPMSELYLYDLFNLKSINESMKFYGYSPINIIVKQEENIVIGKNQEKINEIKHNFNQYIKQKNKIVTSLDIDSYLNFFLRGYSYSLNQVSTYRHIKNKSYINGLENRLYILPQLFKDDSLKNVTLTKGVKILPSEIVDDPIIEKEFRYSGEKYNIHEELKKTIIQTMDVQFQKPQMIHIYTNKPIDVVQDAKNSINTIFHGLKEKLDYYTNINNKKYDIFENINLIDIISLVSEINGIINIDMSKFLESFDVIVENEMESNNTVPLQYNLTPGKPNKIKTSYLIPLTPQQREENFITNTFNLFLFNNHIGDVIKTGISEIFQDYTEYSNFILQSPIQIRLLKQVVHYDYTVEPLYKVKNYVTPIPQIVDSAFSRIKINRSSQLKSDHTQYLFINTKYTYNPFKNEFKETLLSNNQVSVSVQNWISS